LTKSDIQYDVEKTGHWLRSSLRTC